ncbi:thiolase domain-containing protein [Hydrogenophaga sp. BPS33]|uniref:thiolase domain-containing protein n=1 Tax=Hydrogenophaga sp. BPS33 TaxID=2651974 RepID=UPI00131F8FEF|nr:thiolase domain-containing protein [Hydrogenophaga sp. BPS33]QHE87321.1 thiolase domain-containing protein [Hydrogenophaga sp. BPS33]
MTHAGQAFVVGAFEHPQRHAPDQSVAQLHAECAQGALRDAGLQLSDVDAYFCAGDAPGASPAFMADYLNLRLKHVDGTEVGGCSYLSHIGHAAQAIAQGSCNVALITLAGKPRSSGQRTGTERRHMPVDRPNAAWEAAYGWTVGTLYGNLAMRHMHLYGTTPEQLAWIKVAASVHAQHNLHALLPNVVTVDEVLASPLVADPLHRLDCCVITDGGGALVITRREIAKSLDRPLVRVRGCGETVKTSGGGYGDMLQTGAAQSGAEAFQQAGVRPQDIQYASIYDNFTIMVLLQLEDLGFCEKGRGGRFVEDGGLIAGQGRLAWNTDGGGLCNNHPANRGGITKAIEAVRQLRGEAAAPLQVPGCSLALAAGPGGVHGLGHSHATVIMERI